MESPDLRISDAHWDLEPFVPRRPPKSRTKDEHEDASRVFAFRFPGFALRLRRGRPLSAFPPGFIGRSCFLMVLSFLLHGIEPE